MAEQASGKDYVVREVRDEDGTRGLEARFEVEAPPEGVLELLWDTSRFAELYPEIEGIDVLQRAEARMEAEYRVNAVLKKVRYRLERTIDRAASVIRWRELGGDLRRVRGEWRVEPAGASGGSSLTYRAFVDVGYFVPTSLVRDLAMRKIGEMVTRVRKVATRPR